MALDSKGSVPFFSKIVKKMALRKNWRDTKREQDKIVKYLANQTKDASFNYIITRPSDTMIWNKPSRKKLAASKSVCKISPLLKAGNSTVQISKNNPLTYLFQLYVLLLQPPGPFPITNFDLAEFTLCALRKEKLYNSCPYVVQDGI